MAVLGVTTAVASQPGQPLDCEDWVFNEPGLSCQEVSAPHCELGLCRDVRTTDTQVVDNDGRILFIRQRELTDSSGVPNQCGGYAVMHRIELVESHGSIETVLAYVDDRCWSPPKLDAIEPMAAGSSAGFNFDAVNGRVILAVKDKCNQPNPETTCSAGYGDPNDPLPWVLAIEGFTTLFEVLQSYDPPADSFSFRVPYMPEGFEAADWFDTYWGYLERPLDLSQATPLQCEYPSTAPQTGDYLEIADLAPTPAPGRAVYYLTRVTFQGAERAGRRLMGGQLAGRDASVLPDCVEAGQQ